MAGQPNNLATHFENEKWQMASLRSGIILLKFILKLYFFFNFVTRNYCLHHINNQQMVGQHRVNVQQQIVKTVCVRCEQQQPNNLRTHRAYTMCMCVHVVNIIENKFTPEHVQCKLIKKKLKTIFSQIFTFAWKFFNTGPFTNSFGPVVFCPQRTIFIVPIAGEQCVAFKLFSM